MTKHHTDLPVIDTTLGTAGFLVIALAETNRVQNCDHQTITALRQQLAEAIRDRVALQDKCEAQSETIETLTINLEAAQMRIARAKRLISQLREI